MLNRLSRGARSERGFTLIELLLVILIIAILAAIAIPSFLNQRAKGYDAASKTNLNTAATAMQAYSTEHNGAFPGSVDTHNGASDPLASLEPSLANAPYVTGGCGGDAWVDVVEKTSMGSNGLSGSRPSPIA